MRKWEAGASTGIPPVARADLWEGHIVQVGAAHTLRGERES